MNTKTEEQLYNIVDYYKGKYSIEFAFFLETGEDCCYNFSFNYISFSISEVIESESETMERAKSLKNEVIIIFPLLHELYHAIDYHKNKKRFLEEFHKMDKIEYRLNKKYHNSVGFEARADEFARKELLRWIK